MHDQAGHLSCPDSAGSQLGQKESLKDTANFSDVPVWNGITDEARPTQVMADQPTMQAFGEEPPHELSFCHRGDAGSPRSERAYRHRPQEARHANT